MDLFQPDTILAPQFFATLRRQAPSKRGEWQLIIAVLEDAINCFQKYFLARDNQGRRLFRDAYEWIMVSQRPHAPSRGNDDVGFTFEYICEVLGLEPDYLRGGLERWREQQLARGIAGIQAPPKPPQHRIEAPVAYDLSLAADAPSTAVPA